MTVFLWIVFGSGSNVDAMDRRVAVPATAKLNRIFNEPMIEMCNASSTK